VFPVERLAACISPGGLGLMDAIRSACRFLLARRDRDGWWRDFDFQGRSDEWVTAYAALALFDSGLPQCRETAASAWALLHRSRWWRGGWGFSRNVPCDADSTAYALLLAARLSARGVRIRRAYRQLARHVGANGGVATYKDEGALLIYTRTVGRKPTGWCSPHPCVSAAVACLRRFADRPRVVKFLRDVQRDDGGVPAYWWCDREYATAVACDALSDERVFLRRAADWAAARLMAPAAKPSPFAVACALRILLRASGHHAALSRSIEWLCAEQLTDGSWTSSAHLRLVMPDVVDPDAPGADIARVVVDPQRIFTTATVAATLALAQQSDRL